VLDGSRLLTALIDNVECEVLDVRVPLGDERDVFDPWDELHYTRDLHACLQPRGERVSSIFKHMKTATKGGGTNNVNGQSMDKVLKVDNGAVGWVVAKFVEMGNTCINASSHERLKPSDIPDTKHGRQHTLASGVSLLFSKGKKCWSVWVLSEVAIDGFRLDPVLRLNNAFDLFGITNRDHTRGKNHDRAIFLVQITSKSVTGA
jgi:hypothetical protein